MNCFLAAGFFGLVQLYITTQVSCRHNKSLNERASIWFFTVCFFFFSGLSCIWFAVNHLSTSQSIALAKRTTINAGNASVNAGREKKPKPKPKPKQKRIGWFESRPLLMEQVKKCFDAVVPRPGSMALVSLWNLAASLDHKMASSRDRARGERLIVLPYLT